MRRSFLKKHQKLNTLLHGSRKLVTPFFIFHVLAATQHPGQFAVICSKKSAKSAVSRNRMRRLAKEHFRQLGGALQACNTVAIARYALNNVAKEQQSAKVRHTFQQLLRFVQRQVVPHE